MPVSAVTNGSNPLSLLPKQLGGIGPWFSKTVCPSNSPSGSFWKLYILILHEKSEKTIHIKAQYSNFHLKLSSSLVWQIIQINITNEHNKTLILNIIYFSVMHLFHGCPIFVTSLKKSLQLTPYFMDHCSICRIWSMSKQYLY